MIKVLDFDENLEKSLLSYSKEVMSENSIGSNELLIEKFLNTLPKVKSPLILQFLVKLYAKTKSKCDLNDLLQAFIQNSNENMQKKSIEIVFEYCCNNDSFEEKLKISTEILQILLRNCSLVAFEYFFTKNISFILKEFKKDNLNDQSLNFNLIEILFLRLPNVGNDCSISRAAKDPKLRQTLLKYALDAFKKTENPTDTNLRLYKCHALNCVASIVINSIKTQSFYEKLFSRQENNVDILWNGIVDTKVNLEFPVYFETLPSRRKVLINLREEFKHKRVDKPSSLKYLESQRLFNSSLSEDVTNFDFSDVMLRTETSQSSGKEEAKLEFEFDASVHLDSTSVNDHECMATLCGVVRQIFSDTNELPLDNEVLELPIWMKGIRNTLLNKETHRNVKIFLVKLLDNCVDIFSHYSKWFLEPLLEFVINKYAGDVMNYFVTDIVVIIATWAEKVQYLNNREKELVSELVKFLIKNLQSLRREVFKYNLELLKIIVESWKTFIKVPEQEIIDLLSSPLENILEVGVHVCSVFLVNGLAPWGSGSSNDFFNLVLKVMEKSKKNIYRPCSETIGLILRKIKDNVCLEKLNIYLKKINQDLEKFSYCLEGLVIYYPSVINVDHITRIITNLITLPLSQKILYLKLINQRLAFSLDILEETTDFKIIEWHTLLDDPNLDVQINTLEIVLKSISVFKNHSDWPKILEVLFKNVSHPNFLYRNLVFDIAVKNFKLNSNDELSKEILILGLVDADENIQIKARNYWAEHPEVPKNVNHKLPYFLSNLYKSRTEDRFLGYLTFFLLQNFKDETLFEHPLEDCNFQEYKLNTNWRLQHPSVVPMFAETLQTYENSELTGSDFKVLRKTLSDLDFAATATVQDRLYSKYTSLESSLMVSGESDSNPVIKNPNALEMSYKYRLPKRRFLKDRAKISIGFAHYETKKKAVNVLKKIDLAKKREKKVTIYRSYRKGDFPDIQISLSSILMPLKALVLSDGEISKTVFLEIYKNFSETNRDNKLFTETITCSIKHIFSNTTHFNSILLSALFDILLKNREIKIEANLIVSVSQQSGLNSVGALILEEYVTNQIDEPSPSKIGLAVDTESELTYWIKLVELYKDLEEWDVVRAIFLEKMNCKEAFQKAVELESDGQWREAQDLYKELLDSEISSERKDFYYESYFKCFANMGEWNVLPETIESVLAGEKRTVWDLLWEKGWARRKLLPWYVEARIKDSLFSGAWNESFADDLNKCLVDSERGEYLETNFSEELSMLWLYRKDIATASLYLKLHLRNFLNDWQQLSPMFRSLRYAKILKLRNVIEAEDVVYALNNLMNSDFESSIKDLTNRWLNSSAEILPSVILNETRLLFRTQFIELLTSRISNLDVVHSKTSLKILNDTKIEMDIDLIVTATAMDNFYIAKKYFKRHMNMQNIKLKLAYANIVFLKSKLVATPEDKLQTYGLALEALANIPQETQNESVKLSANSVLFDILLKTSQVLHENQDLISEFRTKLVNIFKTPIESPTDINLMAFDYLKSAVNQQISKNMDVDGVQDNSNHKNIAKAFVKLANFIREFNKDELKGEFISYVLKAMKLNSSEAKQLFPSILMLDELENEFRRLFIIEAEKIPTWMFLGWIPQLLANVDTGKVFAIAKVILRIAEMYPQAIMYPYRLSKENYRFNDDQIKTEAEYLINSLDKLLLKDKTIDEFLKALSYVAVPAVILRYYVRKIVDSQNDKTKMDKNIDLLNQLIFQEECDSGKHLNVQGNMFKLIGSYKRNFAKLSSKNTNEIITYLKKLDAELREKLLQFNPSLELKDYCPWLANFSLNKPNLEIEIPGQYDGRKLPLVQHHVKISGFSPKVTVMSSLRKPVKITMIGNDTKEYPFLVKFGEDIRQDQRIQQLFVLMNDIFKSSSCLKSDAEILTYQVTPLTTTLGLIQWINDTQCFKEFIGKSISDKKLLETVKIEYFNWLPKDKIDMNSYGKCVLKFDRNKTISKYRSLVNQIPWDVMNTSFWSLSITTEHFIALKNNFTKSYAVLCVGQWLLGIGDRHVDNSLICLKNGKVLGIDFGHAFGTATQILPIPELIPFRLTPHLVNVMGPLKERGQFRESMIRCLRALRMNGDLLLATMHVFIQEPSLDWLEHARRFDSDSGLNSWYPNVKIDQAKRKLKGAGSVEIMVEDLEANCKLAEYKKGYVGLVSGLAGYDKRFGLIGRDLNVEEQVECLLDHATDYNLLGRTYVGWMPWI